MSRTLTGQYASGVTLSNVADNPVTVANTASVSSQLNGIALYGESTSGQADQNFPWTVTNFGVVRAVGTSSNGILLESAGLVTNGKVGVSGYISGGRQGISMARFAGTVDNFGIVTATGSGGVGVDLHAGGTATNFGVFSGYTAGLEIDGAAGTVANYGSITATGTFGATYGVRLKNAAGSVLSNAAAGYIGAADAVSVYATNDVTIINSGVIENEMLLEDGATIINGKSGSTGGRITGFGGTDIHGAPGTVVNYGSIDSAEFGIRMKSGGSFSNAQGSARLNVGSLGSEGIIIYGGLGSVGNLGSITAAGTDGGSAILLGNGGTVTNGSPTDSTALLEDNVTDKDIGIEVETAAGTVTNFATINAGYGVLFRVNGLVNNAGIAAYIVGQYFGVVIENADAGTNVTNLGTIRAIGGNLNPGFGSHGVDLMGTGGTVVNGSSVVTTALIEADESGVTSGANGTISNGVIVAGGTIVNYATMQATRNGAYLFGGGDVVNGPGGDTAALMSGGHFGVFSNGTAGITVTNFGTIAGTGSIGVGIGLANSGNNTLTNGGTISGAGGTAVTIGGVGNDRLVVDPGAVFTGVVAASASASNTLELASAGSAGTLSGFGSTFDNFGSIVFDTGSDWFISGSPNGLAGTISGFALGDTIEVSGISATGSLYFGGALILSSDSGPAVLNLPGSFSTSDFVVTNVAAGADVTLACFAAGTRIRTERGAVPVEALHIGDRVPVVLGGAAQPIVWLGHRRIDCRRHADPTQVWPVRLCAGAFGPGRPFRDLLLSPDHALFIDGVLIPVRYLVNGSTIRQEAHDAVTYWHVELPRHDVVFAEGVPTESYLDTGNRGAFVEGGAVRDLHPDFARGVWEAAGCAPLVVSGSRVAAAKRRLIVRAMALGHRLSDDPDITVLAGGRAVPVEQVGRIRRVRLPRTRSVRLVSRVWQPAHVRAASDDTRSLGIGISRVWIDGTPIGLDAQCLSEGWHGREAEWRWTDGDACVVTQGARTLAFEVALTGEYWREAQVA
jgi:hypothetical protein